MYKILVSPSEKATSPLLNSVTFTSTDLKDADNCGLTIFNLWTFSPDFNVIGCDTSSIFLSVFSSFRVWVLFSTASVVGVSFISIFNTSNSSLNNSFVSENIAS